VEERTNETQKLTCVLQYSLKCLYSPLAPSPQASTLPRSLADAPASRADEGWGRSVRTYDGVGEAEGAEETYFGSTGSVPRVLKGGKEGNEAK
jgi:hypothetical protein